MGWGSPERLPSLFAEGREEKGLGNRACWWIRGLRKSEGVNLTTGYIYSGLEQLNEQVESQTSA